MELPGPVLLNDSLPFVVPLDGCASYRKARDRLRLALRRLSALLRWRSRSHGARPKITAEIHVLIRRLAEEIPDWGAPEIHGEFLKLGFVVSERSVARYLRHLRCRGDLRQRWLTFLQDQKATGLNLKRTSVQAPWQNNLSERWVGTCRREILDDVTTLNEQHLRRLIRDYVSYYHKDRTHDSLEKDTPNTRPVDQTPAANATVISMPRLGGLHHRDESREGA